MRNIRVKAYLFFIVSSFAGFSGCVPSAHSPPSRPIVVETVGSLSKGAVGIQGGIGGGSSVDLWGRVGPLTGNGRVRVGILNDLEGALELNVTHLFFDDSVADSENTNIWGVRGGVKYNPYWAKKWMALFAGAGGGGSQGGRYFGPDVGFVVGHENPYAAPFLSGSALFSFPTMPEHVDFDDEDRDPSTNIEFIQEPWRSVTLTAAAGVKIPLHLNQDGPRPVRLNLIVVLPQFSYMRALSEPYLDFSKQTFFIVGGLWVELTLGDKSYAPNR